MKRVLQSCSLLLLLCAATAHAQLYKWVGPDGKITYSDTPPPSSVKKVETKSLSASTVDTTNFPFELAEAAKNNPVTLYTTGNCTPCEDARQFLSARGIPFKEKTVSTAEDIAELRKIGRENELPQLAVGRMKKTGFEAGSWNTMLTNAGYPESSRLPKSYRNPQAEALVPPPEPKPATAKKDAADGRTAAGEPATDVPPPAGNAPPGFRF
jgi:glutaredoxin